MSPIFFNRSAKSAIRILAVTIAVASSVGAQAPAPAFGPANPFLRAEHFAVPRAALRQDQRL